MTEILIVLVCLTLLALAVEFVVTVFWRPAKAPVMIHICRWLWRAVDQATCPHLQAYTMNGRCYCKDCKKMWRW